MITGNEPAMPIVAQHEVFGTGINIRQYYAGIVLQGLISNPNYRFSLSESSREHTSALMEKSLLYADALIEELNKNETL